VYILHIFLLSLVLNISLLVVTNLHDSMSPVLPARCVLRFPVTSVFMKWYDTYISSSSIIDDGVGHSVNVQMSFLIYTGWQRN